MLPGLDAISGARHLVASDPGIGKLISNLDPLRGRIDMDRKFLFLRIRNFAELDEPGSPELANIILPLPPAEAMAQVQRAIATLPLWHVEATDPQAGTLHLTRTTRMFRFVDDIRLKLEPVVGGTRVHGRSQSRVGLSDFGQNRRNLRQLIAALRTA
jgi:uncharacterized protein (DUF1499 family)